MRVTEELLEQRRRLRALDRVLHGRLVAVGVKVYPRRSDQATGPPILRRPPGPKNGVRVVGG